VVLSQEHLKERVAAKAKLDAIARRDHLMARPGERAMPALVPARDLPGVATLRKRQSRMTRTKIVAPEKAPMQVHAPPPHPTHLPPVLPFDRSDLLVASAPYWPFHRLLL